MLNLTYIVIAAILLIPFPAKSETLKEVSDFVQSICGDIPEGHYTREEIQGKVHANIETLVSIFKGSAEAGGDKTEEFYRGIPFTNLPDNIPTESMCKVELIKVINFKIGQKNKQSIKHFTNQNVVTIDGGGSRSGELSDIQVSVIANSGDKPDSYTARWVWSGSGGTQHGSQTVLIHLKSDDGSTAKTLTFPLDRDHCYDRGHAQVYSGNLDVQAELISQIEVSVTPVEGTQHPC